MDPNLAVILRQLCYCKISFIVLVLKLYEKTTFSMNEVIKMAEVYVNGRFEKYEISADSFENDHLRIQVSRSQSFFVV